MTNDTSKFEVDKTFGVRELHGGYFTTFEKIRD